MAGGGGGGDGGAQKMEDQRQARVTSAINVINSIFNGSPTVRGTGQANAFDPNQTYYTAEGTKYVAPTKVTQVDMSQAYNPTSGKIEAKTPNVQSTGGDAGPSYYDPRFDASLGSWAGGGDAGETWTARPGVNMSYDGGDAGGFRGVYRDAVVPDVDAINEALGNGLYTGFETIEGMDRKGMYDQQRQAVTDLNRRDVDRQFLDAERQNRFGLARAGLSGGSADIDSNAELARRTNEGLMKASGIGDQAAADLQTSDERSRQNLISMAQSGIDTGQAAQMALSQLDANSANAQSARAGATVGSLFGDLSQAYLYGQQQQGARAGAAPYQQWTPGANSSTRTGYSGSTA